MCGSGKMRPVALQLATAEWGRCGPCRPANHVMSAQIPTSITQHRKAGEESEDSGRLAEHMKSLTVEEYPRLFGSTCLDSHSADVSSLGYQGGQHTGTNLVENSRCHYLVY